nr:hypothetical protein [uncultured Actinoplanes sp.]
MMQNRGILLPLALSGLVGLTLSGCAGHDEDTAPADPKAALTGSVAALKDGNFAFTAKTPEIDGTGAIHLPSKSASLDFTSKTADGEGAYQVRLVDPDSWVKITVKDLDFGAQLQGADPNDPQVKGLMMLSDMFSGKAWMHFDKNKVKGDAAKDLSLDLSDGDITGVTDMVGAVATAQGDEHTITGTIDATKVTGDDGFLSADDIKSTGATSVPFSAALDDQGRLSSFEVDMPKSGDTPAGKWTLQISGYGQQKAQEKPTGSVQEMPEPVYSSLNS